MIKTVSILMLAAGMTFSVSANTSQFNYDYAEVSYGIEGGDSDNDGEGNIAITGSHAISPSTFVLGSYATNEQFDLAQFGVGMRKQIQRGTDLLGSVKVVHQSVNGSGYGLSAGLRHDFSNDFEGEVSVNMIDVEESNTNITAGTRYHFSREMSGGIGLNDSGTLIFNLRMAY